MKSAECYSARGRNVAAPRPRILAVLAVVVAMGCGAATAQSTPSDLGILGLKLGMTVDEATTMLKRAEPDTKFLPLYATDDPQQLDSWNVPNGGGGDGGMALVSDRPGQPTVKDAHHKVQIGLFAVAVHRIFDGSGQVISAPSARIESLEGDLFYLRFTPTDDGGKLYGIGRYLAYAASTSVPSDAPKKSELEAQIAAKYDRPSESEMSGPALWLYDAGGKLVSSQSNEFNRCRVSDADKESIDGIGNLMLSSSGNMDYAPPDMRTLNLVLDNVEGTTLSVDDQINVSAVLGSLEHAVNVADGTDDRMHYRKCGVELQTFVRTGGNRVVGLAEELEDINALYFDNGIKAYIEAKAQGTAAPAAPAKL